MIKLFKVFIGRFIETRDEDEVIDLAYLNASVVDDCPRDFINTLTIDMSAIINR